MTNGNCVEVMVFDDGSADVRNSRKPTRASCISRRASGMTSSPASRTASSAEFLFEARGPGAVVRRPGFSFSTFHSETRFPFDTAKP